MRTRTPLLALVAVLLLAPAADAATPFTAGTGFGHDLAVGGDGVGHVVWLQDESPDRLHYCRVPAGGSACDGESGTLSFPDAQAPNDAIAIGAAQVFVPTANKIVIVASCWQCGPNPNGTANRTFRWASVNNGADFGPGAEVGDLAVNGQSGWYEPINMVLGTEGGTFQPMNSIPPPETVKVDLTPGSGLFVYSPAVVYNETLDRVVYAVNDLDVVKYAYRVDADPTPGDLDTAGEWVNNQTLPGAEADNDETHLSTGPTGIFLSYRSFVANDNHIGLRRFDTSTNAFSPPVYAEGPDPIDNNSLDYPHHSQDGAGHLHFVWRSLYDDGRLRYSRSDDGGATFTPAANLAMKETFIDPIVEAAPSGAGFAAWKGIGASSIRVVPIDPQPEPSGGGGPGGGDTTPPTAGTPRIGDPSLTPGQGTTFTFTTSENGVATLTVQKQVKGMRVRVRGKRRCVPQTRKRLRALRRRAGSPAAFRRALRRSRCKAYKRIGTITQRVTAGENTIVFNGRIAGRKLRPGHYRALLVIRDLAGNVSRAERVRFRVLRPRPR